MTFVGSTLLSRQDTSVDICDHRAGIRNRHARICNYRVGIGNDSVGICNHSVSTHNHRLGIRNHGVGIRDPPVNIRNHNVGIDHQLSLKESKLSRESPTGQIKHTLKR